MTPQQQADYDFALSQIKPKCKIDFAVGSMPVLTIKYDAEMYKEAVKAGQEAMKKSQNHMDAIIASMGVPNAIFTVPNCRCTIIPKGSTTDAQDPQPK